MVLMYIKIGFVVISGLSVAAALLLWLKYKELEEQVWEKYMGKGGQESGPGPAEIDVEQLERLRQHWQDIQQRVDNGGHSELKLAVIEADKVVDTALKLQGVEGEDMGGRLKEAQAQGFRRIDRAWTVHKVRNRLVHEQGEFNEDKLRTIFYEAERILKGWNIV